MAKKGKITKITARAIASGELAGSDQASKPSLLRRTSFVMRVEMSL